jgi:hypothetical protein
MLGNKRYSNNNLGNKNYSNSRMGNKNYSGFSKGPMVGSHSPDGVIHNYANSSEAHREPVIGIQINPPKRTGMNIEKPRKRTESKENNYV